MINHNNLRNDFMNSVVLGKPYAAAYIRGGKGHTSITGTAAFYKTERGVVAVTEVSGLGDFGREILACHIHSGGSCSGTAQDPFANAGTHYNPEGVPHPYHAGDMPPLFCAGGYAFCAFVTDRFTIDEIIGKTVIIHSKPDDFTTQPSGNAGSKIACGVIRKL